MLPQLQDYVIATIPGFVCAMIILTACQATTAGIKACFVAVFPPLFVGATVFRLLSHWKNARLKTSIVLGVILCSWTIFAFVFLLKFRPYSGILPLLVIIIVLERCRTNLWGNTE